MYTVSVCADPIRILHVVPDLEVGGLQSGLVHLVNGLPRDGFHHEVCCLHEAGRFRDRLPPVVRVHELRAGWHDPRAAIRLARVIRRLRPEIVHARNWSTWPDSVVATALARGGRLIFSLHGWDTDAPVRPLRAWACRRLSRHTDHLCSVSRHAARLFAAETGLDPRRFEILPNGVDIARFAPRDDRAAVRGELGIEPDALVIGTVGRLAAIKDYSLLMWATAVLIRGTGARCRLLVVGDGDERSFLEALARRLGIADRVDFVGWREDVDRLLGAMDLFAMTSRREGMNNAILEAMATGLPVVATAVGGTPEMIEDGRHGRLVPPGDPSALVRALKALLDDASLRRQMGEMARLRVAWRFSLDSTLARYAWMYRRLLRHPDAGPQPAPARGPTAVGPRLIAAAGG